MNNSGIDWKISILQFDCGVCLLFSGQELENSRSCQGNIAEGALSLCCILFLEK